jgi:hypothetical protein
MSRLSTQIARALVCTTWTVWVSCYSYSSRGNRVRFHICRLDDGSPSIRLADFALEGQRDPADRILRHDHAACMSESVPAESNGNPRVASGTRVSSQTRTPSSQTHGREPALPPSLQTFRPIKTSWAIKEGEHIQQDKAYPAVSEKSRASAPWQRTRLLSTDSMCSSNNNDWSCESKYKNLNTMTRNASRGG